MNIDPAFQLALQRHSSTPSPTVRGVSVCLSAAADGAVRLHYRVDAVAGAVVIPSLRSSAFKDGLWQHTCFELFAQGADGAYREFNFSPSTEFAIYEFAQYRTAMTPVVTAQMPSIQPRQGGLSVDVELPFTLMAPAGRLLNQIGIAAVIEDRDGTLSYWALRHSKGKPDFHHREGFIVPWPLHGTAGEHRV